MTRDQAHGSRAYRLTVVGLVVLLAGVVFANSWGVFTADIKPEVYLAPKAMISDYLSAWTFSPYLGGPNFNVGLAPVVTFVAVLRDVGLSPEMAFKTFHLILLLAGAIGMARLIRRLDPAMSRWIGLVAAVAYVANPYTVSAGATLAIALPMALLPWQLLTLVRALEQPSSWRWPALFGLTFFLMSGMNAGVVPVLGLLAVIPVAMFARRQFELRWRSVANALARCAFFVVWLSLYWLIPSIAATATGTSVVDNSETSSSISDVSSFSEVMRGLGLWPLYGAGSDGPWQPGHAVYLTGTAVILATFLMSALAVGSLALVRNRLVKLLAALMLMAAVVMVGMYPTGSPSPFGRVLAKVFDAVPALSAFRTTNKIGAVLVLGAALASAVAFGAILRRLPAGRPARVGLITGCAMLSVVVSLPAWTGKLYISEVDIPRYWKQAAAVIDDAPDDRRVLALPGQVQASYRWSQPRPDDVFNSLFSRDVIVPITTPSTSATAFNFGAALDDTFQSGLAANNSTSTFARYLGADTLLLRHDVVWEDNGGARPSQTQATVNADSGLTPVRNFGRPGENVLSPTIPPDGFAETNVPPLQLYGVDNAQSMVRTESERNSLIVAGDGWAIPAMGRRGLLNDVPVFRYAQDLAATDWSRALKSAGRVVLTDTNRRREAIANRLTNGQGPLLSAMDPLPATARTLGSSSTDQTVLKTLGGQATASSSGYAFFDLPWAVPDNAFDNDPQTAWIFGDFKNGKGQTLKLALDEPRPLGEVTITQAIRGPVRISSIVVSAGGEKRRAEFGPDGVARVDLGMVSASDVTFSIGDLVGDGFNAVGIQDIAMEGVNLTRVARTPQTLDRDYEAMTPSVQGQFNATPLDVLLTRAQGTSAPDDDEEVSLERDFSIPSSRHFSVTSRVRLDQDREDLFDTVAGLPTGARSSSRFFDNPDVRASMAFDGNTGTAWIPGETVDGPWIELDGPERALPTLTFDQRKFPGADQTNWASRITVTADGRKLASAEVSPGKNTIDLTADGVAPTVQNVRVTIEESVGGTTSPPRIVEIGAGRTLEPNGKTNEDCLTVSNVDGRPLRMRPVDPESVQQSAWRRCGSSIKLDPGAHSLRSTDPGVTLDSLDLRDVQKVDEVATPTTPAVSVKQRFGAAMTVNAQANPGGAPYYLTIGQAYDPRWQATANGKDLGAPVVVDGYGAGWLISSSSAQTVEVVYGPQRSTNVAIAVSALGLLAVALLIIGSWATGRFASVRAWRGALRRRRGRLLTAVRRRLPHWTLPALPQFRARSFAEAPVLRRALSWSALLVGAWVFASWPGALAVIVLAGWHAYRAPTGRQLILTGAGLILLAGPIFVLGMGEYRGTVTAALITSNPWPNVATVCGLVFVLVGVCRSDTTDVPIERYPTRG